MKMHLTSIKNDIAIITGPEQLAVGCKGRCESMSWAL